MLRNLDFPYNEESLNTFKHSIAYVYDLHFRKILLCGVGNKLKGGSD